MADKETLPVEDAGLESGELTDYTGTDKGLGDTHRVHNAVVQQPVTDRDAHRSLLLARIITFASVIGALALARDLLLYFQSGIEQALIVAVGAFIGLCLVAVAYWQYRRENVYASALSLIMAVTLSYSVAELVLLGLSEYVVLSGILLIALLGITLIPSRWPSWTAIMGLFALYVLSINFVEPLPRYNLADYSGYDVVKITVSFIVVLMAAAVLWQVIRTVRFKSLRDQLLIAFVSVVLLSAFIINLVSFNQAARINEEQLIDKLEAVATLKEGEINDWIADLKLDMKDEVERDGALRPMLLLLQISNDIVSDPALRSAQPDWQVTHDELFRRFEQTIALRRNFDEFFLMNLSGEVILSSNLLNEGKILNQTEYFRRGAGGQYISPPTFSPALNEMTVVLARPIVNEPGDVIGVFAGRVNLDKLGSLMEGTAGLGETGETYLVAKNRFLLRSDDSGSDYTYARTYVRTEGVEAVIKDQKPGTGIYMGYRDALVAGVYHWIPELEVALLVEQERAEALARARETTIINLLVTLASVLLAGFGASMITRSISSPLAKFASTATQIADGDFSQSVEVDRDDEVGLLANAFNTMTSRLRQIVGQLEERVLERTQELERRSAYFQASAEVSRAASSILDVDLLIHQVVDLIQERFNLYYVGLFLVDDVGKWAILRAGTGEAGRKMLARNHRLQVGEGMIGWTVAHGEARIALQAAEDAVRQATSELPETRSEAALPLRSRGQVIGALSVQDNVPNAFDEDSLAVLQTMADQVAIAIDNARLLATAQDSLEAMQQAYGRFSQEAWAKVLRAGMEKGYLCNAAGQVRSVGGIWHPAMVQAFRSGAPVRTGDADFLSVAAQSADGPLAGDETVNAPAAEDTLAVPVKVRDQVLGVIRLRKPADTEPWNAQELELIESLTDKLGDALEAARLYQETQRRAVREQATREITDKMRRATSVDALMQTTVREVASLLGVPGTFLQLSVVDDTSTNGNDGGSQDA
ncbi:MAG: GAF domain-containing protein [Anaerolineae bacterium]|nr:GAF domain-containing protein [Anaerolineae bacterium]